jgi:hypothetical protein
MITILDQWDLYENEISEKELLILENKIDRKRQEFYRKKKQI